MIKKSKIEDLENILKIYEHARSEMKKNGNPNQWKDDRPKKEDIISDILNGYHYSIFYKGMIVGVFTLIGEEETYRYIEGAWLNDKPYKTIHKIASLNIKKGILKEAMGFAFRYSDVVRIDTHQDNKIMQHLLDKYGFRYCGIIYLKNGDPRLAYMKEKDYE